jgi:C-terminal processing protease CtpA/Prc
MKNIICSLCFLCLLSSSCKELIFDLEYDNNPVGNFESMWSEFDQIYGLFRIKNIDWDSVHQVYRPQINKQSSETELYNVLVAMMTLLNDSHTGLLPTNSDLPQFQSGAGGRIQQVTDFHLDIVKDNYLSDPKTAEPFTYDYLTDEVGYLYIAYEPGEKTVDKLMPEIIDYFKNAKSLIIDIRVNTGGEDRGGQAMASYFTDQMRLYMTSSVKDGPGPDDFTTPEQWYLDPKPTIFSGSLFLLTNRSTVSAGETLALAMRSLPQLSSVGDTTTGAFANAITRELPNGWLYSMSIGEWRAADGTSFEGQGIPPDLVIQNDQATLLQGIDQALEKALEMAQ